MDIISIAKNFTKYCKKTNYPNGILKSFKTAIDKMWSGRFGPVLIDIPVNIQMMDVSEDIEILQGGKIDRDVATYNGCRINEIISSISESKRPLVLAGRGIHLSDSEDLFRKMIDVLDIPFVTSWNAIGVTEHSHKNYIGSIGVYGERNANFAVQNCDILLILGSRLDTRQTGGKINTFSTKSKKIIVDIDLEEIRKFVDRDYNMDIAINADLNSFLMRINSELGRVSINMDEIWRKMIGKWKMNKYRELEREKNGVNLNVYSFLNEFFKQIPENSVIIPDCSANLTWTMQTVFLKKNQKIFSNLSNSSMGYSLPASIGAAIGCNSSKQIYCIIGDGGLQMNIQEFQTVVNYGLPIKIILINNHSYGMIKQFQEQYFNSRYIATDSNRKDYSSPDFNKISDAYCLRSELVTSENYEKFINDMASNKDSCLYNVQINPEQRIYPKLTYGNSLENMYPFLSENELNENMIIEPKEKISPNTWG